MHDGESKHSSSASRSIGELRQKRSRKVLFDAFRTFAIACGAFVSSRRWLLGALLITGVLLTLISLVRPSPHHALRATDEPDILFDDVKTYPLASRPADLRFRPELGGNAPPLDADLKPASRMPKRRLSQPPIRCCGVSAAKGLPAPPISSVPCIFFAPTTLP